jgi:hypothetical protein
VLYAELQKNTYVYLKAIQCATHVWTSFKMTEQNNKDDPTLKPNPPSVINTVDKKRAEARNNYARAAFETSNF